MNQWHKRLLISHAHICTKILEKVQLKNEAETNRNWACDR